MKKVFKLFCFICVLTASLLPAVGQKRTTSNQKVTTEARTFDYGTIDGQLYTNNFLGIRFTVPADWKIEEREKEKGYPDAPKILLFAEFSENPAKRYASFLCVARKIPVKQKSLTPKKALEAMIAEPEDGVSKNVLVEKLGSNTFVYIEKISAENKKRMYAVTKNGYLILFSFMYLEERDLETMKQILAKADFTRRKS